MSGPITSVQNPRVKFCVRLHERRERRESGQLLVEGFHELSLAWQAGLDLRTLFVCPELIRPGEDELRRSIQVASIELVEVSPAVMAKMTYREHPDAWLGLANIPQRSLDSLDPGTAPLIILTENLEKPGNLGAILRSADAVGASAVVVCDGRTDVYNPNVVRASKGSLFTVPVIECSSDDALNWLKAHDIAILAATPEGSSNHWDVDLSQGIAIAVGAEKEGLTAFWMNQASIKLRIPMLGRVNSLNVAQAATVIAYEALRQRTQL